jgi:hypothetical protein
MLAKVDRSTFENSLDPALQVIFLNGKVAAVFSADGMRRDQ